MCGLHFRPGMTGRCDNDMFGYQDGLSWGTTFGFSTSVLLQYEDVVLNCSYDNVSWRTNCMKCCCHFLGVSHLCILFFVYL